MKRILLFMVVISALALSGCQALMRALPEVLPKVVSAVSDAALILDQIESVTNVFFMTHPDPAKEKAVADGITKARAALVVAQRTATGVDALSQADLDAAFEDFREAYAELRLLLDGIPGLRLAGPGESMAASPGEVVIPAPQALTLSLE